MYRQVMSHALCRYFISSSHAWLDRLWEEPLLLKLPQFHSKQIGYKININCRITPKLFILLDHINIKHTMNVLHISFKMWRICTSTMVYLNNGELLQLAKNILFSFCSLNLLSFLFFCLDQDSFLSNIITNIFPALLGFLKSNMHSRQIDTQCVEMVKMP